MRPSCLHLGEIQNRFKWPRWRDAPNSDSQPGASSTSVCQLPVCRECIAASGRRRSASSVAVLTWARLLIRRSTLRMNAANSECRLCRPGRRSLALGCPQPRVPCRESLPVGCNYRYRLNFPEFQAGRRRPHYGVSEPAFPQATAPLRLYLLRSVATDNDRHASSRRTSGRSQPTIRHAGLSASRVDEFQ